MRVTVIVLGDLARSPRTLLHARALVNAGVDVDLAGFADARTPSGDDGRLRVWPLNDGAASGSWALTPYPVRAAVRGARLFWALVRLLLWEVPRPDVILVQNPPGVPTLFVVWLAARLRSARFLIDWHNLTWSMVSLRVGERHALVWAVSAYERFFGRRADANLFVSEAMRVALASRWGLRGSVFHDRPSDVFHPLEPLAALAVRARLFESLGEHHSEPPALVVTATSWSADEDFSLLLDALRQYDAWLDGLPRDRRSRVVMVITGRGPLRDAYERRFAEAALRHIGVHMLWLAADDYPRVLAAADLGVSLHRSSSGLDLPMKVLDMFGAGIPVCALNYGPCLEELVKDGANGLLFRTSQELATQFRELLGDGSQPSPRLQSLRSQVRSAGRSSWEQSWRSDVWPLIEPREGGTRRSERSKA